MKGSGIPGVVIAVDTWLGSCEHRINADWFAGQRVQNGQPTLLETFMTNVLHGGLQDFVLPLPLDSASAAELIRLAGLSADLIHLDSAHDSRSVSADIERWWPLLRSGGILIGDDYYPKVGPFPRVRTAFDAFTAEHDLRFDHDSPKICIIKPATPSAVSADSKAPCEISIARCRRYWATRANSGRSWCYVCRS